MRALRRTFAASAVVITACEASGHQKPEPIHDNPPAQVDPKPANPPPPDVVDPAHGHADVPPTGNPPQPDDVPKPHEPIHDNPPAPNNDLHWTITNKDGKCTAFFDDACRMPNRKPSDPIPPCNPPVPTDYKCQAAVTDASYKVVKRFGATKCFLDYTCPANAKCRPTPELDCPR